MKRFIRCWILELRRRSKVKQLADATAYAKFYRVQRGELLDDISRIDVELKIIGRVK